MKHKPSILSGQIPVPFLRLAADGAASGTGGDPSQQQQQQQQQQEPADPFEGLDLELLPEDQRKLIEGVKAKMKDLSGQAASASALQSKADQLEHLAREQQALLQKLQTTTPSDKPLTAEEIVAKSLSESGVPAQVTKGMAPALAQSITTLVELQVAERMKGLAPFAEQSNATAGFMAMQQLAGQPYMQHPEIVEAMKTHLGDMMKAGTPPNVQVLHNIGAMEFGKLAMSGKLGATPTTPVPAATKPTVADPMLTLFGIPSVPANTITPATTKAVSPEVAKSMESINAYWDKLTKKK